MLEFSHPLFIKGHYRVVALTEEQQYDENKIMAYAVLNASGAKLRHELSLDEAKAWMEKLVEEDNRELSNLPSQIKQKRARR
ncbi:MAG: hypothetical protein ABIP02_09465 [Arenimonas sp.]